MPIQNQSRMKDDGKTREQLFHELTELRAQNVALEELLSENRSVELAVEEAKRYAESILNTLHEPLIVLNQNLRVISANRSFYERFKVKAEETKGQLIYDLGNKQWDIPELRKLLETILPQKTAFDNFVVEYDFDTLGRRILLLNARQIESESGKEGIILLAIEDITERQHREKILGDSEELFRRLFETASDGIVLLEKSEGKITNFNKATEEMLGFSAKELIGGKLEDIGVMIDLLDFTGVLNKLDLRGIITYKDITITAKSGKRINSDIYLVDRSSVVQCNIRDTTQRKQAEEEREKLQLQLNHSQKLEAVGRLAGGVAHDFNNILGVILGYAEMALGKVEPDHPVHAYLEEILNAVRRSTGIIRQLLAFARKQTIDPKVLDLNQTVEAMLKMLRRLIGEDLDLVFLPGSGLWPVKMDPTQIEQLLANLLVNARDAIAQVGKVTIETGNAAFDQAYCADHPGFVTGEYALLAVSDDGCGMDKKTLDRIFEPFFTTKEVGQGTGLGLATVYGIVKQNNGFINVYSEPREGTTFKIYLPRQAGQTVETQKDSEGEFPLSRGETVLVVEDEVSLLKLASEILEKLGYTVLSAGAPGEALHLLEEYTGEIHLLLTDVILPEMSGRHLAEEVKKIRPGIKCLFMSGYTADVIAQRGMIEEGVQFIPKPFSMRDLAYKVRTALEKGKGTGPIVERSRPASPQTGKSPAHHCQPVRRTPLPTGSIGARPARLMKRIG